jgi:hypothetical protein
MAQIFPSIDNIKELKVPPTQGEQYLLNYLIENLNNNIEIYFQPFLNGDMPDIILMEKDVGVTIIEVKDWNLDSYSLNNDFNWKLKSNGTIIKSPYKQIYQYKDNMFNLHINGLLEKKILDKRFYGRINIFVYFHNAKKQQIRDFFRETTSHIENEISLSRDVDKKRFNYNLNQHKKVLKQRDYYSIGNDNIKNIVLPRKTEKLFPTSIYEEFHRYLQPPFHTIEQGIHINYTSRQKALSVSVEKQQKIKGVAGSGKTLILAKRAVDAHKRHNSSVLILTFNITLTSYIHDMISNVREDFNWNNFTIINYHHFFNMMANNYGLDITNLSEYDNENFFHGVEIKKYKSIFIDEIQDYEVKWLRIIKEYFLETDGELVVFGDEKQNIYDRKLSTDKRPNTTIDGRWNELKESFRLDTKIAQLAEDFQNVYFKNKYDLDKIETTNSKQGTMDFDDNIIENKIYDINNLKKLVAMIFDILRRSSIHPNDTCILSYNINILRDVDSIIRHEFNEKTLTTFETNEVYSHLQKTIYDQNILKSEIKNIRKVKKYGFRLNNGMMKLSTIQSFKGWEIPTLFLIIENDLEEVVYTAITRARHNIIVFNIASNKYYKFFKDEADKL